MEENIFSDETIIKHCLTVKANYFCATMAYLPRLESGELLNMEGFSVTGFFACTNRARRPLGLIVYCHHFHLKMPSLSSSISKQTFYQPQHLLINLYCERTPSSTYINTNEYKFISPLCNQALNFTMTFPLIIIWRVRRTFL